MLAEANYVQAPMGTHPGKLWLRTYRWTDRHTTIIILKSHLGVSPSVHNGRSAETI